jgi:putative pyruvate formate lyase activating enzyme
MGARCVLCPRRCAARRDDVSGDGVCGVGLFPRVAAALLHKGEEPCLSGVGPEAPGSGAVFFAGCALRCVYCQNGEVSQGPAGRAFAPAELGALFQALERQGAWNINLVSGAHVYPAVLEALRLCPPAVPVVWNTSAYETVEAVDALAPRIDVFLPDFKYADAAGAAALSGAPDYPEVAARAILRMREHTGPACFDAAGRLLRGTLVRHLILPGRVRESMLALNWLAERLPEGTPISLMGQYTPCHRAAAFPGLDAGLSRAAYARVRAHRAALGLDAGYNQPPEAAGRALIPAWDAPLCR